MDSLISITKALQSRVQNDIVGGTGGDAPVCQVTRDSSADPLHAIGMPPNRLASYSHH